MASVYRQAGMPLILAKANRWMPADLLSDAGREGGADDQRALVHRLDGVPGGLRQLGHVERRTRPVAGDVRLVPHLVGGDPAPPLPVGGAVVRRQGPHVVRPDGRVRRHRGGVAPGRRVEVGCHPEDEGHLGAVGVGRAHELVEPGEVVHPGRAFDVPPGDPGVPQPYRARRHGRPAGQVAVVHAEQALVDLDVGGGRGGRREEGAGKDAGEGCGEQRPEDPRRSAGDAHQ